MINKKISGIKIPKYITVSIALATVLILSVLSAVTFGTVQISIPYVYSVIIYEIMRIDSLSEFAEGPIRDIIWLIRLPRIFLAATIGAGLSVCGIVMQAIVKNPLADPYILGVSSGASLGAVVAIILGIGVTFGPNYVGIMALIGAFSVSMLVLIVSNIGSRANSIKLLLSGFSISAVCSAFTSFIVFYSQDRNAMQTAMFWIMGSLSGARWDTNIIVFLVTIFGIVFFQTQSRMLNMMLLGDEVSITLGTDLHKYRIMYLLVASAMIGFIVFSSGVIGFVGLIIPHFVRMFFGTDHMKVIPVSALVGAIFMIWADVLSRTIMSATELPIGILVSMIGAPCFVYMLVKSSYGFGGVR